jgi:hypothetical protein
LIVGGQCTVDQITKTTGIANSATSDLQTLCHDSSQHLDGLGHFDSNMVMSLAEAGHDVKTVPEFGGMSPVTAGIRIFAPVFALKHFAPKFGRRSDL